MILVDEKYIPLLDEMLYELYENRLEVCLVPGTHSDDDRMIRAAVSNNTDWYQQLCKDNPSTRKRRNRAFDTKIRRRNVELLLTRMIKNKQSSSVYAEYLIDIAKDRFDLYEKYKNEDTIPWDNQF